MDDPNEGKVPFCVCCQEGASAKKGQLIYPCLCRRISELSCCFHYKCLVRYIEAQLDRNCPQCRTPYEDPRIERYQIERRFSEFIWRFFFGPWPVNRSWTAHFFIVIAAILWYLSRQIFQPIYFWGIGTLAIYFVAIYLFTIWLFFDMYCEGWPHDAIRFHEFSGAPNGIRIFDLTEAEDRAEEQRVEEEHQEQLRLALIHEQDELNNPHNVEHEIFEPEIDQVVDEYEDDDEVPDHFYVD